METNKTITVSKDILTEAYKNGDEREKMLLERIYGEKMFQNVMDRVKGFYDAYNELGVEHPLVKEYFQACDAWRANKFQYQKGALAYLKLRIVVAALNEGWKPQFTADEQHYYPCFRYYTQSDVNKMGIDELAKVFLLKKPIGAIVGVAYVYSLSVPSTADTNVDYQLCFKSKELAEYAGKNFIWLYVNYCIGR